MATVLSWFNHFKFVTAYHRCEHTGRRGRLLPGPSDPSPHHQMTGYMTSHLQVCHHSDCINIIVTVHYLSTRNIDDNAYWVVFKNRSEKKTDYDYNAL